MKKKYLLLCILPVVLIAPVILINCPGAVGIDVNGRLFFSWPILYLTTGGSVNYDDYTNPISGGTEITDATVTVTNDTTENSVTLTYTAGSGGNMGSYGVSTEFTHTAGQNVSVEITANGNTFTGASTQTPDSSTSITYPANNGDSASQPFNLTWSVTAGTYTATNAIIYIYNFTTDPWIMKWAVVPLTQGSYEISGLPVANDYYINVFPVNVMSFSGGGTITGYVGTTATVTSRRVNITG